MLSSARSLVQTWVELEKGLFQSILYDTVVQVGWGCVLDPDYSKSTDWPWFRFQASGWKDFSQWQRAEESCVYKVMLDLMERCWYRMKCPDYFWVNPKTEVRNAGR